MSIISLFFLPHPAEFNSHSLHRAKGSLLAMSWNQVRLVIEPRLPVCKAFAPAY